MIIIILVLLTLGFGFSSVRAQAGEKHVVKGPVKHLKGDTMLLGNKGKPFEKVTPEELKKDFDSSLPQSPKKESHIQTSSAPRERAWFPHPCRLTSFMGWMFWVGLVLLVLGGVAVLRKKPELGGVMAGTGGTILGVWLVILILPYILAVLLIGVIAANASSK